MDKYLENMPMPYFLWKEDEEDNIKIPAGYAKEEWNRECVHLLQKAFSDPIQTSGITIPEYVEVQDWLMNDQVSSEIMEHGVVAGGEAFVNNMLVVTDESYIDKWLARKNKDVTNSENLMTEYATIDLVTFTGIWFVTESKDLISNNVSLGYSLIMVAKPETLVNWKRRLHFN